MKVAAIVFTAAFAIGPLAINILRSVVHRRRHRRDGLGGTQDIAMWGTFTMLAFGVLAAICWSVWYASE